MPTVSQHTLTWDWLRTSTLTCDKWKSLAIRSVARITHNIQHTISNIEVIGRGGRGNKNENQQPAVSHDCAVYCSDSNRDITIIQQRACANPRQRSGDNPRATFLHLPCPSLYRLYCSTSYFVHRAVLYTWYSSAWYYKRTSRA